MDLEVFCHRPIARRSCLRSARRRLAWFVGRQMASGIILATHARVSTASDKAVMAKVEDTLEAIANEAVK
jgi:hypothetical protein